MILEAYMRPRGMPVPPPPQAPSTPCHDLPPPPSRPRSRSILGDAPCGSAASAPLIVEEIELTDVHPAVFSAEMRDSRNWAAAHHPEDDPALPTSAAPDPSPAGRAASFCGRDETRIALPEVRDLPADAAEAELFTAHWSRPLRFDPPGSTVAQQAAGERAWIHEALAETAGQQSAADAGAPAVTSCLQPHWLHGVAPEALEEIVLQPVDLATRVQAAAT